MGHTDIKKRIHCLLEFKFNSSSVFYLSILDKTGGKPLARTTTSYSIPA